MTPGNFEYTATENQQIPLIIEGKELGWIDRVTVGLVDDGDEYPPILDWFCVTAADGSQLWNVAGLTESVEKWLDGWYKDDYEDQAYWEAYNSWKDDL